MRILHYSLGLPPYRSGGLTRYALDLMAHQADSEGHDVALLYPGPYTLSGPSKIQSMQSRGKIAVHEIVNPCLVPLLNGIPKPSRVVSPSRPTLASEQERILDEFHPDVLHVHTLMGLPGQFLSLAKARGVRIVYTTHDYFGLCPRATFVDPAGAVCKGPSPENCDMCNQGASGMLHSYLHSQKAFHRIKNQLRHLVATRPKAGTSKPWVQPLTAIDPDAYEALIEYYQRQFSHVDHFHFTSSVSEAVYRSNLPGNLIGTRIPVIHAGISDHRPVTPRNRDPRLIRFGFIGDSLPFKGCSHLKDVLGKMSSDGLNNWVLSVFGPGHEHDAPAQGVVVEGPFKADQLEDVYSKMDVLVVPSLWKETFSLVALEALSYGVPVMLHANVGAKDVVAGFSPEFVISDPARLEAGIRSILAQPGILDAVQAKLMDAELPLDHAAHSRAVESLYRA